jgi:hypothetical protein
MLTETGRPRGLVFVPERVPEIVVTVAALVFFGWGVSKNGYGQTYYATAGGHGAVKVQRVDASSPARHRVALGTFEPGDLAVAPRPGG